MAVATETRRPLGVAPDPSDEGEHEEPAGEPTGEVEGEGEAQAEEKPVPPMQIPIPGTGREITDVAGGSAPTSTEVRLLGGSIPLEGQFDGEERVQLLVEAVIGAVEVVYTTDDWGQTKAVKRRHKARMISVQRVGVSS